MFPNFKWLDFRSPLYPLFVFHGKTDQCREERPGVRGRQLNKIRLFPVIRIPVTQNSMKSFIWSLGNETSNVQLLNFNQYFGYNGRSLMYLATILKQSVSHPLLHSSIHKKIRQNIFSVIFWRAIIIVCNEIGESFFIQRSLLNCTSTSRQQTLMKKLFVDGEVRYIDRVPYFH